jgi:hypothetical protein
MKQRLFEETLARTSPRNEKAQRDSTFGYGVTAVVRNPFSVAIISSTARTVS